MLAMAEDIDVDIFKFGSSNRPSFGSERPVGRRILPPSYFPSSSSDSGSEDDKGRPKRRRHGTKKSSMAASRLLKRSTKDDSSSNSDSDDMTVDGASKRLKPLAEKAECLLTPSRSPSPPCRAFSLPSRPSLGIGPAGVPSRDKVLNEADDVLNRLRYTAESSLSGYHSGSDSDVDTPPPPIQNMTLRIRYKGKVIKYEVNKCDPFSDVLALLGEEMEGTSDDNVLLVHKTTTIKPTDSPASLGLTTADIISAILVTNTILEFRDDLVGLMLVEEKSLKVFACQEGVELCPLPSPRLGFQLKGGSKGVKEVRKYCDQLHVTMERNVIGYEQIVLNVSRQPVYATEAVRLCRTSIKRDLKVVTTCQGRTVHQAGVCVAQNHITFISIIVGDLSSEQSDAIVIPTGRAVDTRHSYPIELPSLPLCGNLRSLNNPGTEQLVEVGQTGSLDGGKLPCSYIIHALFPLAVQKSSDNEINDLVIHNSLSLAMQMNLGSIAFPGIKAQMIRSIVNSLCSLGPTSLHTVTMVLGTKFEAKLYVEALHSITSSSAGLETEKSYAGAVNFTASTLEQGDVIKSSSPMKSSAILWKWRDDSHHFTSYSLADSAKIEAMFQLQNESAGHIVIEKKAYMFDFNSMKQVNILTGFSRDVQRVTPGDSVVGSFLSDDEVVINLKGPRENLAVAKEKLKQKIKSMLTTEKIPFTTKLAPSHHQTLQTIARKHHVSCVPGEHDITLEGLERHMKLAVLEVGELILQSARLDVQGSEFPVWWDSMSKTDFVKIIPLSSSSPECGKVCQEFQATMPDACVVKVQRVQNKELWSRYMQCMSRMQEKNAVNEKFLFHGTRGEPAEKICRSEEGFDMRFSREGMWGQANYFAVKASYSHGFAHNGANGYEMILAKVLTGDSYYSPSDSTLRMPPEKHQHCTGENQLQQVRYDSVNGVTNGSIVYMTYSNDRAYPAYIITYSMTQPTG